MNSHFIGMMLIQYPRNGYGKERKENMTKLVLEDNDLDEAFKLVEPKDRLEKVIIQSLRKHPNGFRNAFDAIARNTRIIYIHAYQSYIWNKVTSERIKTFGNKVLIGDLVSSASDISSEVLENSKGKEEEFNKDIQEVTEDNINDFTIYDVVMPLIGKSVKIPENSDIKALYEQYMAEDEITLKMFESKSMEGGCAHGAYRHIGIFFPNIIF